MADTAKKWKETEAETFYSKSAGLSYFGMSKDDFTREVGNSREWLNGLLAVWSDGKKKTNEIVTEWTESFKSLTASTRDELNALKETADKAGYTSVSAQLQTDIDTLDAMDKEITRLLKKRQSKNFTEKDKIRLQELIDTREAIEVKYHLSAADTDGFDTIRNKVEAEIARAKARGQEVSATVYENAMVAAAEGMAAVNASLDQQYDQEYALIQLIEDATSRQQAMEALNARYNQDRRAAALEYAQLTGIGIGKVAETSGYAEFGWPLKLSTALAVAYGGTGSTTAAGALANLGGVKKTGDTMTGNLNISGYLYPSMLLLPTYNNTTNRTVFEGSYVGASSFASWEDATGNNRRMLEVRTKAYANSLDNAVMLRVCDAGTWGNYRIFHAGMPTGVPIANGGTGATTAANARSNLGANNASNLTTGTLPAARLPFKVAYGSGSVAGNSALSINYSSAGFTSVPYVVASYSTTGSNWSGDNGALKIYAKTTTGATIIVGGNFNTARAIDWIAIGQ